MITSCYKTASSCVSRAQNFSVKSEGKKAPEKLRRRWEHIILI